jgi:hypothetical protein
MKPPSTRMAPPTVLAHVLATTSPASPMGTGIVPRISGLINGASKVVPTVNSIDRDDAPTGNRPRRVKVLMGRRWIDATAHGRRIGPHGAQLLVLIR